MLEILAGIFLIVWFLGVLFSYTIGGFIHLLLVAAGMLFMVRVIEKQNPAEQK